MRGTPQERFEAKVDRSGGPDACHLWTGKPDENGYGQFNLGRKADGKAEIVGAHRAAWRLHYGTMPDGVLDHLCSTPACVNVRHLDDTTQPVNAARTAERGRHGNTIKSTCPQGHSYDLVKTRGDGRTFRACSVCSRASVHRRRGPEKKKHSGPRRAA